jgi:TolB-like protein
MASLLPGFEYDIYISYRQKDNKHDGWVTEFVDNLKGEIESTFKEEISVYFDINPHDGLLETHDVDASLKDKLKCLIFIPIISRTYCDPKSFAWEYEFKAFIEQASKDQYGLKVKLPGGNVANRVLPVQIHDLDAEDKKLVEDELVGHLRGIEFIYKELGVNRPLMANEDHPDNNLNKTFYRNQINKVANAIKEVISAIKLYGSKQEEELQEAAKPMSAHRKNHKTTIIAGSVIVLVLIVLGFFIVPMLLKPSGEIEKSIAVLPFNLLSDEPDKQYLADGMMDAITLHLSKIKDLRVLGRTSTEQYRDPAKTLTDIGKELDVSYLLEGSFQKFGDSVRLIVQLIKAGKEGHVWANNYDRLWKNVFFVQSEVAQAVARELYASISQEEKRLIEKLPTSNMAAYDLYLKANDYLNDYEKTRDLSSYHTAVNLYATALKIDSVFAKAYTGLASAYYDRYQWETYFKENYLDSMQFLANKALTIDDQLDEAYYLKGVYYNDIGHNEEALNNFDNALKINPNYYAAYERKGFVFDWASSDFVKCIDSYQKALNLIRGDERSALLRNLASAYLEVGFINKAKYYFNEAFTLDNNQIANIHVLSGLAMYQEKFEEGLNFERKSQEIDSTYLSRFLMMLGDEKEAYLIAVKIVEYYKKSGKLNLQESHRIGYAFSRVGKHEEAKSYFKQQIKYSLESINLNRRLSKMYAAQYDLAATYAFLGDKGKVYKYLDEFNKRNNFSLWWILFIKYDPLFASIRNEERFHKILQNMEIKYNAEHERVRKWLEETGQI